MNLPATPFTNKEITRAKRAQEVMWALLADGAPAGYWAAIRLDDGKTHGAAYPTKAAAMAHCQDPNVFAFASFPADGIIAWTELAAFLRYAERKESYWRAREDQHLVIPKHGITHI